MQFCSFVSLMSLNVALAIGSQGLYAVAEQDLHDGHQNLVQTCWLSRQSDSERPFSSVLLSQQCLLTLTTSFWCSSAPEPRSDLAFRILLNGPFIAPLCPRVFDPFRNTAESKHGGNSWLWIGDEESYNLHLEKEEMGFNGKLIKNEIS